MSNKPSPETIERLLEFLYHTTLPRLIEEEIKKQTENKNKLN
jgi:hypothetical protein